MQGKRPDEGEGTAELLHDGSVEKQHGVGVGRCYSRHRGREFLSFLREIERNVRRGLDVHLGRSQDRADPEVARRAG
jgi:hypothetical protein